VIQYGIKNKKIQMQNEKLTVMISYRDREENLGIFVPYFRSFMKHYFPNINYEIVVIEQGNYKLCNKDILYNAGYMITSGNTDYYALHDVDALPIASDYSYHKEPHHLFVNTIEPNGNGEFNNVNRKALYGNKGGVLTVSKEIYKLANGHSNNYWGWGLEDDDFSFRLFDAGYHLQRYGVRMNHTGLENNDKGYYVMIPAESKRWEENKYYKRNYNYASNVVNRKIDWRIEGLNTTEFEITNIEENEFYIKYTIDYNHDIEKQ